MMMDDGLIWVKIGCNTTLTVKDLRDGSVITVLAALMENTNSIVGKREERQSRIIFIYFSSSVSVTIAESSSIPPASHQLIFVSI